MTNWWILMVIDMITWPFIAGYWWSITSIVMMVTDWWLLLMVLSNDGIITFNKNTKWMRAAEANPGPLTVRGPFGCAFMAKQEAPLAGSIYRITIQTAGLNHPCLKFKWGWTAPYDACHNWISLSLVFADQSPLQIPSPWCATPHYHHILAPDRQSLWLRFAVRANQHGSWFWLLISWRPAPTLEFHGYAS